MDPIDQIVAAREQVVRYSTDKIDPAALTMPHPILADYLEEHPHHLHEVYPEGHKRRGPGRDFVAQGTLDSLREGTDVVLAQHPTTRKVAAWRSPKTKGRLLTTLPEREVYREGEITGPVHHGPLGIFAAGTLADGRPTVHSITVRRLGASSDPNYPHSFIDASPTGLYESAEAAEAEALYKAWYRPNSRPRPLEDLPDIQESE